MVSPRRGGTLVRMNRRGGAPVGGLILISGFGTETPPSDNGLYEGADSAGPRSAPPFSMMVVVRATTASSPYNGQFFCGYSAVSGSGYCIRHYNGITLGTFEDATPAQWNTPSYVHSYPSDTGKDFVFIMTGDGSTIRLYAQGIEVGSGTATGAGFTVPPAGAHYCIGSAQGGDHTYSFGIYGSGFSTTCLSSAQVLAHYTSTVAAGHPVPMTGSTFFWNASTACKTAGATWSADIGAAPLTKTGTNVAGVVATHVSPNWA